MKEVEHCSNAYKSGSLRFVETLPQKPQRDCAAISSASPVDTRTAEWIAARRKRKLSHKENWEFTVVKSVKTIFSANVRSAGRVFTGEAG
jgi:adenosyl cobinamide kinase/adenosyl cobinamide phosphate guanylyltransferase